MRVLIAILSCVKDRPLEDAHRESCFADLQPPDCWVKGAPDYRYFLGGSPQPPSYETWRDEVWLGEGVGDDYASLPFKTQAICRWALENEFDYLFKADTDTFIHVPRLLTCGYEEHHYSGFYRGNHEVPGGYASGGSGYWLSRRAMEIVVDTEMEMDRIDGDRGYVCGEDLQVGRALWEAGIKCHWSERYRLDSHLPEPGNDVITTHDVRNPLKGPKMLEAARHVREKFGRRH